MSGSPRVLVLTAPVDPTADMVLIHLSRSGVPFCRFDTADFPTGLSMTARIGPDRPWRVRLGAAGLDHVVAVYYRRPGRFVFDPAVRPTAVGWCEGQARYGLWGVLEALPIMWINHPTRVGWAEYKPRQLDAAAAVGLAVPPTLVTNQPAAAAAFAREHRRGVVTKALYARMPRDEDGRPSGVAYTTLVPLEQASDPSIGLTAHLFQARVHRRCDVRVTVVGDRMFAAELYPDNATPPQGLDWREHHELIRYRPCPVPSQVAARVLALMNRLELRFGALDFHRHAGGRVGVHRDQRAPRGAIYPNGGARPSSVSGHSRILEAGRSLTLGSARGGWEAASTTSRWAGTARRSDARLAR